MKIFEKRELIPAIIQDVNTSQVLMLGYMNEEAYQKTLETSDVWFYSRSKQRLWKKGETSDNVLRVVSLSIDCDNDTILVQAEPAGPTCHTGAASCFSDTQPGRLERLFDVITRRKQDMPDDSYTTRLFNDGLDMICAKVEEESLEVIQAAKQESDQRVIEEAADVLFHLQVLLVERGIEWKEMLSELAKRSK